MKFLAIDPGTNFTGWALYQSGALVKSGVMQIAKGAGKWADLYWRLREKICAPGIEAVVLERQHGGGFASAARSGNQVTGMILALTLEHGIPLHEINPSQWRLYALGKGNADKRYCQEWVSATYDLECGPDQAEAIGIGAGWWNLQKLELA